MKGVKKVRMLSQPPPSLSLLRDLDHFHHEDERDRESHEDEEEREDGHEESAEPRTLLAVNPFISSCGTSENICLISPDTLLLSSALSHFTSLESSSSKSLARGARDA